MELNSAYFRVNFMNIWGKGWPVYILILWEFLGSSIYSKVLSFGLVSLAWLCCVVSARLGLCINSAKPGFHHLWSRISPLAHGYAWLGDLLVFISYFFFKFFWKTTRCGCAGNHTYFWVVFIPIKKSVEPNQKDMRLPEPKWIFFYLMNSGLRVIFESFNCVLSWFLVFYDEMDDSRVKNEGWKACGKQVIEIRSFGWGYKRSCTQVGWDQDSNNIYKRNFMIIKFVICMGNLGFQKYEILQSKTCHRCGIIASLNTQKKTFRKPGVCRKKTHYHQICLNLTPNKIDEGIIHILRNLTRNPHLCTTNWSCNPPRPGIQRLVGNTSQKGGNQYHREHWTLPVELKGTVQLSKKNSQEHSGTLFSVHQETIFYSEKSSLVLNFKAVATKELTLFFYPFPFLTFFSSFNSSSLFSYHSFNFFSHPCLLMYFLSRIFYIISRLIFFIKNKLNQGSEKKVSGPTEVGGMMRREYYCDESLLLERIHKVHGRHMMIRGGVFIV
ncbi:hypothetical protein VP01_3622g1 [Puccinia sorghi]|uniref:Uncharacterized protein n=1 Tax=Puccinia sorghi TaxID=27349 RepID=A0A0L6UVM2_9BASI|nr:hypothetical protein VP01_3622g1 [Puccinia sorghi]